MSRMHRLSCDGFSGSASDAPGLAPLTQGEVVGCGIRCVNVCVCVCVNVCVCVCVNVCVCVCVFCLLIFALI